MKTFNAWINFDRDKNKLVFGPGAIRRSFAEQLARPKEHARKKMGNAPTLIGEVGIAYDLDDKHAYRTGDFRSQIKAYDRILQALDENLHNYTLWNYTADNTNGRGDMWNDEDLSIFSRDQQQQPEDIHSGGRALEAVVRPYPLATAGEPLRLLFDSKKRSFKYSFRHDPALSEPTIIFVPQYQYPNGCIVEVSDGEFEINQTDQKLIYRHSSGRSEHTIHIKPDKNTRK
jgi:hypothetical protein